MNLVGKYAMPDSIAICQPGSAAQVALTEGSESEGSSIRTRWSYEATNNRAVWKYWIAGEVYNVAELILLEKAGN